jgi:ATP-binding cassette, subfamily B, bacterial HlyB/CyaB
MNTQETKSRADFLASVDLLSALTRNDLDRLAESAQSRLLAFGDTVCSAGEAAEGLFVVRSGSIRVFAEEGGKEISLGVRKAGDVVAEMAMLRDYRHELSARASAKTELLFIPRSVIAPIVAANPAARAFVASRVAIGSAGGLISKLFDLRGKVDKGELEDLIRSVGVKQVDAGKEILKQGAREDRRLYVVRHGEVRVVRQDEGTDYPLATLRQGDTFGEKACLMRQEQVASVVASTDVALLVIPEKTVYFSSSATRSCARRWKSASASWSGSCSARRSSPSDAGCRPCSTCSPSRNWARTSSRASPGSSRPRRWTAARPVSR